MKEIIDILLLGSLGIYLLMLSALLIKLLIVSASERSKKDD